MQRRSRRSIVGVLLALGAVASSAAISSAHDSDTEGHVPPDVNYGFDVIGRDVLDGITSNLYTDVWSHDGYAYIGTFQEPGCSDAGVFVVDIAAAIEQYDPEADELDLSGATVAEIRSAPDTRINDVKVHEIDGKDVLIATQEKCGSLIPGSPQSDFTAPFQLGKGGISLYDVSDPTKPHALKRNWLPAFDGVHNTFSWTTDEGTFLIGVGQRDFINNGFYDTFIADISKPQSPKLLVETGILDWLDDTFGGPLADGALTDGQFETGTFPSISLHDVWVENVEGQWQALLPYWDAGYIVLDVNDPANPVFLGDSTYPATDPLGRPYEGNAHAGVFGGSGAYEGDYLFVGDEDFDPTATATLINGIAVETGGAQFGGPADTLSGTLIDTGTTGCNPGEIADATGAGQVAVIDRGGCFFSTKVYNAEQAGFEGAVIVNNLAGDGVFTMGAGDPPLPTIPSVMIAFEVGAALRGAAAGAAELGTIVVDEEFNGWGYLRVLNNQTSTVSVPSMGPTSAPMDVDYLGELGYYAPAQTLEEGFYDPQNPIGDLTMHNIEVDPSTQDIEPSFDAGPRMFVSWYSLGMRALEYRPGHFHANANGEGSYSQNVHEVGRFIAEDGSNFWGVHVDTIEVDDEEQQIILASDRSTGLWIFTFGCDDEVTNGGDETPFYCRRDDPDDEG